MNGPLPPRFSLFNGLLVPSHTLSDLRRRETVRRITARLGGDPDEALKNWESGEDTRRRGVGKEATTRLTHLFEVVAPDYRERFKEGSAGDAGHNEIAFIKERMSEDAFNKAVQAYKLLPPLVVDVAGGSGGAAFPVDIPEVLEILRSPECPYSETWVRHCLYEISVNLAERRRAQGKDDSVDWWESLIVGLEAKGADKRPRGRHNPLLRIGRDILIIKALRSLANSWLLVTSADGPSLAGALAEASGLPYSTIAKVWENAPASSRAVKHSRERFRFAVDVPCAGCGKAGKVPKFRADDGHSRLCTDCLEW